MKPAGATTAFGRADAIRPSSCLDAGFHKLFARLGSDEITRLAWRLGAGLRERVRYRTTSRAPAALRPDAEQVVAADRRPAGPAARPAPRRCAPRATRRQLNDKPLDRRSAREREGEGRGSAVGSSVALNISRFITRESGERSWMSGVPNSGDIRSRYQEAGYQDGYLRGRTGLRGENTSKGGVFGKERSAPLRRRRRADRRRAT